MKWFKHSSNSSNNSFIFELVEKFGSEGYHVFFGVLEIMADEFDIYCPGYSCISLKNITKKLQLSRQKTVKILTFCGNFAKSFPEKNTSFFVEIYKNHVSIFCNRLAELCDNHTQKLLKETSKSLQSNFETTSPIEEEVEEEVEEEKEIIKKKKTTFSYDTFIKSLKENIAYKHINIENELAKMDAWLSLPKNKNRKKTSRFILNWLNKIEAPFQTKPTETSPKPNKSYWSLIGEAENVLKSSGEKQFKEFCVKNKIQERDIVTILKKTEIPVDKSIKKLTEGIGKEIS